MSSREQILGRLRAARRPFEDFPVPGPRRDVAPVADTRPEALQARFVEEAQKLNCTVHVCPSADDARQRVLAIIGADRRVVAWDLARIPLPDLDAALSGAGVTIAPPDDPSVRVGLTGVDAALAATGSLVLASGPGQPRTASLLPEVHVAILTRGQIVPNLEAWAAAQRAAGLDHFRQASHTVVISGPSRTADIAMELVLGAHGPAELHLVILP